MLLVLTGVGFWDSLSEETPDIKRLFNLQGKQNFPPVIPDVTPPKVSPESNIDLQQNQFVQPALANKAQVQLVSVQRVAGKPDEVTVQMRIYRVADKVEPTDTINIAATIARNSITSETYNAVDPVKRSSGIISLSNVRPGQPVDAYVVLKVPEKAIIIDIFAENTNRFKNAVIGIPELGIAGLNGVNTNPVPANPQTPAMPTMPIPGGTATPGVSVPLPPTLGGTSALPELLIPGKTANPLAIATPTATPTPEASPTITIPDLIAGSTSSTPVPAPSASPVPVPSPPPSPLPPPTLADRGVKSSAATPGRETAALPKVSVLDKIPPTLQGHDIDALVPEKNPEFKPGEFAQLAFGSKAKVELLSVQRMEDAKSGNSDVVSVQMRISRLDDKVVEGNVIKLGETTASNSVSNQTYKAVVSVDRITQPVSLKDIPEDGSVDAYVWLKVPKGVYAIDILVPETGAFKNVPISK